MGTPGYSRKEWLDLEEALNFLAYFGAGKLLTDKELEELEPSRKKLTG